ncbi:hypothetical protein [Sporomusa termitida]|uniref:Uncharacterized protein n=1 Tax=Sporomusa termitida TaxID=2377 RepID=A0A517DV35_9FIRM|nr:hypothetical protein [Sporomusa termitida]QDR81168.1 hypothetical protein SPTER_25410 [Sporomusa termitida]
MKQEQIKQLTQKLLACGYHSSQIRHIISEAVESGTADTGSSQEQLIIEALESYVEFGSKCKRTGNRK